VTVRRSFECFHALREYSIRSAILLLALLTIGQSSAAADVYLKPTDNLSKVVAANPAGTRFYFNPGVYRLRTIQVRDDDQFTGLPGAVLNGSRRITYWAKQGSYWISPNRGENAQMPVIPPPGACEQNPDGSYYDGCRYSNDIFFDNKPFHHVTSLVDLGPGKWFFDYSRATIYIADNPAGHVIELSGGSFAFYGSAKNVLISNLIIEKYASPAPSGAIDCGQGSGGWTIRNNEIRFNHSFGVRVNCGDVQVLGNYIHDNGQLGIGGGGPGNIQIVGNEIAFNNYAGFRQTWGSGGGKWGATNNLTVRNNNVHDNVGVGLHSDFNSSNTFFVGNTVARNYSDGIRFEAGSVAVIRNNIAESNGLDNLPYSPASMRLWYVAQIHIANASNCKVYNNLVEVDPSYGSGLIVSEQNPGGNTGHFTSQNLVAFNDVRYLGNAVYQGSGLSGVVTDFAPSAVLAEGNSFDFNTYHSPDPTSLHWAWGGSWYSWSDFTGVSAQEQHGITDTDLVDVTQGFPNPAQGLVALPVSSSQVALSWGPPSGTIGNVQYRIMRVNGMILGVTTVPSLTYVEPSLISGQTYGFMVQTINATNDFSFFSNLATVTIP
jgi:hypothetical protein